MRYLTGVQTKILLGSIACLIAPAFANANSISTDVYVGSLDVGSLVVSDPSAYTSGSSGGVQIAGSFDGNYPPVVGGYVPMWVQLISTNYPLNTNAGQNTPYFDPGELDPTGDYAPFYWNTDVIAKNGNSYPGYWYVNQETDSGKGTLFADTPTRSLSDMVNWTAELDLVLWQPGTEVIDVLWSGDYGFNISSGSVSATGVTTLGTPGRSTAPVDLTQTTLTDYFPGWTLGNPADALAPEPSTFCFLVSGRGDALPWRVAAQTPCCQKCPRCMRRRQARFRAIAQGSALYGLLPVSIRQRFRHGAGPVA